VVLCGALKHATERVNLQKLGIYCIIILEKYGLRVLARFIFISKNVVDFVKVTLMM
jgi:RNase P/RNase MRP subunit p30